MNKRFLTSILAATMLSACATSTANLTAKNDLSLPSISVPSQWESGERDAVDSTDLTADQIPWLARFNDDDLTALVAQAYRHNPNLKRLQAQVDRARAQSKSVRAGRLPVIDAIAGASRTDGFARRTPSSANLSLGLDVSWEADIWGRISAAKQASDQRLDAARSDYRAGYQILAASVIETYMLAIEAKRLAYVAQRNLDALTQTLGFVTVQYERGLRSGQELSLIRADVASATVSLNRAEGASRDALRALEILIGTYPNTQRKTADTLPDVPDLNVTGHPADILTSRPDLQAAKSRVWAAYATHKSTQAAQKPRLSLGGVMSGNANQLGQVLDPTSLAATLFANLTAPIFDGGSRKADIAISKADIDAALADYQDIALNAFRDVERQIDQGEILRQQETALEHALTDARKALRFTQFRYESAESDLFNVLSAQQRVSSIEAQLVSTRRAHLVQYLNLALALSIEPTDTKPITPS